MRLKFFITIFIILGFTCISISTIHFYFFRIERLRLIELNLEQNANLLMSSDLDLTKKEFKQMGNAVIKEIIGDDKVNVIVAIYSEDGTVLYKNNNAQIFKIPDTLPKKYPYWSNLEGKDYFLKFLTVKDANQQKIIKVGMILNQSLIRWKDLNHRIFLFVGIILVIITIISFILTYFLLKPLQNLSNLITELTLKLDSSAFADFEHYIRVLDRVHLKKNDEFSKLVHSIKNLSAKIQENHLLTQRWTALMAHEIKTPLTKLKNSIETLTRENENAGALTQQIENEISILDSIMNNFLDWASLENDSMEINLHAVDLEERVKLILNNLKVNYPEAKIIPTYLGIKKTILCDPLHFDQLISNLLINSIKYGLESDITIHVSDQIIIQDKGPGIPKKVLDNFGTPFNKYKHEEQKGTGLGLAWVNTILKKYQWAISFKNQDGLMIQILFT